LCKYAIAGVPHYAIFDPWRRLSDRVFRVYQLIGDTYIEETGRLLAGVGMGLTLWQGDYEGVNALPDSQDSSACRSQRAGRGPMAAAVTSRRAGRVSR